MIYFIGWILLVAVYFLVRNNWVYKKRIKLSYQEYDDYIAYDEMKWNKWWFGTSIN